MAIALLQTSPYPEELLYSFQARIRVHLAVVSPKALMEGLYDERNVSASIIFPAHLDKLFSCINAPSFENVEQLIHQHTLVPLVAPFIKTATLNFIYRQMRLNNGAGIHTAAGYVASRIPKLKFLRYCPICAEEQVTQYGEAYYVRLHQLSCIEFCHLHLVNLELVESTQKGFKRHEFIPVPRSHERKRRTACRFNEIVSVNCRDLLAATNLKTPSFHQWTHYYFSLAADKGLVRGKYVEYSAIQQCVLSYWPRNILQRLNLNITEEQSCWLRAIFRKHRKSFSYIEHIVVNTAFLGSENQIINNIRAASSQLIEPQKRSPIPCFDKPLQLLDTDQEQWLLGLKSQGGTKRARVALPALYAKLYRLHREWLIAVNSDHIATRKYPADRVDWRKRDKETSKALIKLLDSLDASLAHPRMTKRWLMLQLDNSSLIEKYSKKLPITKALFERYCESITEYQIRRLTHTLLTNEHKHVTKRWYLLRKSGLSEERMTVITKKIVDQLGDQLPAFNRFWQRYH